MDYKDIEKFKSVMMHLVSKGCNVSIPEYGVYGRLVGVGYKPYWTSPGDNIIKKLELNIANACGQIIQFKLDNVIGYKVVSYDANRPGNPDNLNLEIHFFSPAKTRGTESIDKISINFIKEEAKSKNY